MAGPMNWLVQVVEVTGFALQTLLTRKGASAATVIGIAGVVAVLVGVLSIGQGFRKAMTVSATPDSVIVLRSGADSEMMSGLSRDETRVIADGPGVARGASGAAVSAVSWKKGEAPLAAASCCATDSNSGARDCMRSIVKRTVGPAMVMTPMAGWPVKRTGADMADRPRL